MDKSIFRAYDIRGIYPTELDEAGAYKIARGVVEYMHPKKVAIGRDCRLAALAIHRAVCQGFLDGGCQVTDIGITGTDEKIFVAGAMDFDVVINVTASHNPKEWIGMKIDQRGGAPVGGAGEIEELRDLIERVGQDWQLPPVDLTRVTTLNVLPQWKQQVLSFIDKTGLRPLKVVVDAGNGIAGPIVREIFKELPVDLVELYFEMDGNFPNHVPSPIEPENMADLQARVLAEGADLGIGFDGDADRVFLVDDKGQLVTGSEMSALVLDRILIQDPSRVVLYNAICGWNVRDVLNKHQATAIRTKVGHGFIKRDMRTHSAYFACEHSGHFFFRDNFCGDSGTIASVLVIDLLGHTNQPISELLVPHRKYFQIPETNFRVLDTKVVLAELEQRFKNDQVDWLDGLTVTTPTWWANIRPSNTEPLLRLNVEAVDQDTLNAKTAELAELIRQHLAT